MLRLYARLVGGTILLYGVASGPGPLAVMMLAQVSPWSRRRSPTLYIRSNL